MFNIRVAKKEAEKMGQVSQQIANSAEGAAAPALSVEPKPNENETKPNETTTYAAVASKGLGKAKPVATDPLVLPTTPSQKRDSTGEHRDPHGDEAMSERSQQASAVSSGSKKRATELSRAEKELIEELDFGARLVLNHELTEDSEYMAKLEVICNRYQLTLADFRKQALQGVNMFSDILETQPAFKEEKEEKN